MADTIKILNRLYSLFETGNAKVSTDGTSPETSDGKRLIRN